MENSQEKIWNLPNFLTFSRVIIAFVVIYFIFAGFPLFYIASFFVLGMITDFWDGFLARRLKLTTEFGRNFDMIADRFLMVGTVLALIIKFTESPLFTSYHLFQIFIILSREILVTPVVLTAILTGAGIPKVRFVGKLTTFMQGVTFPLILLSVEYPVFSFSIIFAIITSFIGMASALYYTNDIKHLLAKKSKLHDLS
jgi:CDP-diacylglycerol---glycerol-3-phosphate 3-phosphatidyltransferase